jgi:hypothetical protein
MLVDRSVLNGVPQEGLLVSDRRGLAIHVKAHHGLLYQVFGVLPRTALAPQKSQQPIEMRWA